MRNETCKHFRGIQHETCEKGINLKAVTGGDRVGWATRMPCMTDGDQKRASCEKYEAPTKDELDAQEAEFNKMFVAAREGRRLIKDADETSPRRGMVQHVTCPQCGISGALAGSVSPYNGHVHGRCSTDGCLNWME